MGAKAHTTDPNAIREQMLQDMPIEQMEELMGTAMSRSDEMWDRSREAMDPESEMNQRKKANIMGQNQDMIATQMRMSQANAARSGMSGSGIAQAQQAAMGLQGQQQGLMAVQQGLDQQFQQGMGLLGQSQGFMQQGAGALGMQATAIGGANQASVNTMLQNTANKQAAANSNAQMTGAMVGGLLGGMSDRRVKKDINKIGENSQGYNIYEFKYIPPYQDATDDTVYVGVMADEVHSDAVYEKSGVQHVDYSQIDLEGFL